MGRPAGSAIWANSKVTCPDDSPLGAWIRRMRSSVQRSPIGTPLSRSSLSKRAWRLAVPTGAIIRRPVEIGAAVLDADEHCPLCVQVRVLVARYRPSGCEHNLQLRQRDLERLPMAGGIDEVVVLPAQPVQEHPAQIGRTPAGRRAIPIFFEQLAKVPLAPRDVAVGDHLGVDHDSWRDHEADGLNEAQPFLVCEDQAAAFSIRH